MWERLILSVKIKAAFLKYPVMFDISQRALRQVAINPKANKEH